MLVSENLQYVHSLGVGGLDGTTFDAAVAGGGPLGGGLAKAAATQRKREHVAESQRGNPPQDRLFYF